MWIATIERNGRKFTVGAFNKNTRGWIFVPFNQHRPSRKRWPTREDALPRWARSATIEEVNSPATIWTPEAEAEAGLPKT